MAPRKELDASFYDQLDSDPHAQDLDAWWETQTGVRETATIVGIQVPIPDEVPAEMALRPDKVFDLSPDSPEDQAKIIEYLARILDLAGVDGTEVVDAMLAAGIGMQQLTIVFTWALLNGMRPPGKPPVSFARCARVAAEQQQAEAEAGKAAARPVPNRVERRARASATVARPRTPRTRGSR